MNKACCAGGGEDKCIQCFDTKHAKERDQLEDQGVDGRMLLKQLGLVSMMTKRGLG